MRSLKATNNDDSKNEIPSSSIKRGRKRKSIGSAETPSSSKLPKYEFTAISLEAKTIILPDNQKFVSDRQKLINVPPKEGCISVGDLIWAKMQGYPWWPCMVTVDPCTGSHNRVSRKFFFRIFLTLTEYHVQYFGPEPSRGYISESNILPFQGYQSFRDRIEDELKDLDKKKRSKCEQKYIVRGSLLKKWNESISEAEEAMDLNREDRLKLLNFIYIRQSDLQIQTNRTPNNSQRALSTTGGATRKKSQLNSSKNIKNNEDVYAFDDDDAFGDSAIPTEIVLRTRPKGDFNIFLKRHFDEEMESNPQLNRNEVCKKLKEKWSKLDETIKMIYVERKAIYEHESNMLVSKQKLFDKIKSQDPTSENATKNEDKSITTSDNDDKKSIMSNEDDDVKPNKEIQKKTPGRKPRNNNKQSDLNESQKNSQKIKSNSSSSAVDSSSTKKRKSIAQQQNSETSKPSDSPKKSANSSADSIEKRILCLEHDQMIYDDETRLSTHSDASSEKPQKKAKSSRPYCHSCGEEYRKDDKLVSCKGDCERMFHLKCNKHINMIELDDGDYICDECQTGKHRCFACKDPNELDTRKCADKHCKKYYHLSCLEHYYPVRVNEQSHSFICPLHSCITCHLLTMDDNENRQNNRKLMKCMLCPVAYHANEICIGAGTMQLPDSRIICQDHYEDFNISRNNRHINVNYCMACIKVGNLICCERCPAAFHEECLEYKFDHEKNFYCQNCLLHKQLHYGDIVWVKLGQYRWWPGKIIHPNQLPDNVSNIRHSDGEFPVYFYGSHDYYWVNKGRTFLYLEGDNKILTSNSTSKSGNKLIKSFNIATREASQDFEIWKKNKEASKLSQIANKPPPYHHISTNRYVCKSHNNGNSESNHVCDCKPEHPCDDSHKCLNRISLIECDPKNCPVGDKCQNQRFRKMEYVQCKPFRTPNAGWGLKTLQDIKKDRFVIEYVGEIIDEKECRRRLETQTNKNVYFLTLDRYNIIDAGPKGNLARFMNHSCDPNCITQKWMVNGVYRCGIFAIKDIPAGSELTFDYNLDCLGYEQMECKCGSEKCTGFIGANRQTNGNGKKTTTNGSTKSKNGTKSSESCNVNKSKQDNNNHNQSKVNDQKSKSIDVISDDEKATVSKMVHENVCFKCGENADSNDHSNDVIHCNHRESKCTKTYHRKCLNKSESIDSKNWICPRHMCMKNVPPDNCCKEPAFLFCSVCPNSLCKQHASTMSDSLQLPDNQFLCGDHRISDVNEGGLINENEFVVDDDGDVVAAPQQHPQQSDKQSENIELMNGIED
uniref:Histone-lysine N-methyltransferase NSD2 isoform X1 n=1 Tax=Psoroptes ovis TaxID=83912 RepID=A0A3B0QNB5_PSOOV|nr:histone-lysine N-methyltransferase NSD2 isoform X1 [Psoroptes ovis]